ncbi:unnamed protein product [Mytilus coruscus]|uniref:Retrotransposon gag domain-containing protein n=1 Tax=Mytilus coruscus TaxID=42192 RepID=A0A6J7ZTZ1_MYTCO|nr:unnamed protein product [Mytilus coruscus]
METPRIIRRSSTRAPRSVEVRHDNCRSRLFSPADSGVEVSPFPMTPLDAHSGKKAGDPSFRKFMHSSPRSYQSTEVVGAVNGLETKCSWGWQSKPSQCADGAEMVVNANDVAERERCVPSLVSHRDASAPSYMAASIPRSGSSHQPEYFVRRTFSGVNEDVWNEFLQYFENIAELNSWDPEKSRRVLLSTLRGQAETFAYGLPLVFQRDYTRLRQKMEERFGHTATKEKYIAEAKMGRRRDKESLRDFGQALEDLCRRPYPGNPDIVEENALKAFLDKCGQSEDFRLAVKRTRPKNLQEAVINAMQEECLRIGEKDLVKDKPVNRPIYEVRHRDNMMIDASEPPRAGSTEQTNDYEYNRGVSRGRYNWNNTVGGVPRKTLKSRLYESPSPKVKVRGIANMVVKGQIEGTTVEWKIDTGAMSTFITNETFDLILDKPMLSPFCSC